MLSYTQAICSALLATQLVYGVPIPAVGDATADESSVVTNALLGPIPALGDHLPSISATAVKVSSTAIPRPQARPIPFEFDEAPTKRQERAVSTTFGEGNELLDADSLLGNGVPDIGSLTSITSTATSVASTSTSASSTTTSTGFPSPTEIAFPLLLDSEPTNDLAVVGTKENVQHSKKISRDNNDMQAIQKGSDVDPFSLSGFLGDIFHNLDERPNQQGQRSIVTSSGLLGLSQIAEAGAKEAAGEP